MKDDAEKRDGESRNVQQDFTSYFRSLILVPSWMHRVSHGPWRFSKWLFF